MLEDLFSMQSHGRIHPSSEEFDRAVLANQALLTLLEHELALHSRESDRMRALLAHSFTPALSALARRASRK